MDEKVLVERGVEEIVRILSAYSPTAVVREEIQSCLDYLDEVYHDQKKGGISYQYHMVETAQILLTLKPDLLSVKTALLHSVLSAGVTKEQLAERFGAELAELVENCYRTYSLPFNVEEKSLENFRKLLIVMSKDMRVIIIRLADIISRLKHSVATGDEDRYQLAKEAMQIYAPVAERLGIYTLKNQLEDHSLRIIDPEGYLNVWHQLRKLQLTDEVLQSAVAAVQEMLKKEGILAEVKSRIKHLYSIYKKMKLKNVDDISWLYDINGIRIILPATNLNDTAACYHVLGLIHKYWKPIIERLKDYIAVPKPNGYQSLHTTVVGLITQPVEIQIRNIVMDEQAEYGAAAHIMYKQAGRSVSSVENLTWVKKLVSLAEELQGEQLNLVTDVFADRIFVLTPLGEVKDLPVGATPVDFAYSVHTDIGHRCKSAKVNGEIVSLDTPLNNGDVVEILTRKEPAPNHFWLSFVKTSHAIGRIKSWINSQNRDDIIRQGRELLNVQLARFGQPLLDPRYSILKNFRGLHRSLEDRESILEQIALGVLTPSAVIKDLFPTAKDNTKPEPVLPPLSTGVQPTVLIGGEGGINYKLASCCNPQYPAAIMAYATRGRSLSIHRVDCKKARGLDPNRYLLAQWDLSPQFTLSAEVHVHFPVGESGRILPLFWDQNMTRVDASRTVNDGGTTALELTMRFRSFDDLDRIINKSEVFGLVVDSIRYRT